MRMLITEEQAQTLYANRSKNAYDRKSAKRAIFARVRRDHPAIGRNKFTVFVEDPLNPLYRVIRSKYNKQPLDDGRPEPAVVEVTGLPVAAAVRAADPAAAPAVKAKPAAKKAAAKPAVKKAVAKPAAKKAAAKPAVKKVAAKKAPAKAAPAKKAPAKAASKAVKPAAKAPAKRK